MSGGMTPMSTNLAGRVKNTSLPYSRGLLPVFEAVVNAIHAIEAKTIRSNEDKIEVTILRSEEPTELLELKPGKTPLGKITGFIISDTGIGFDEENFEAFQELDTLHKQDFGGRGIGRLMWLKAFESIDIESIYAETGKKYRRSFSFGVAEGVVSMPPVEVSADAATGSTISLKGFLEKYRNNVPKSGDVIARDIMEHCMWYYLREGNAPEIVLIDGKNEAISLDDFFEDSIRRDANDDTFSVQDEEFGITHLKLRNAIGGDACISYCANNRVVKTIPFSGNMGWVNRKMSDERGAFVYRCYVTAPFLDNHVRADRLDFDFDGDAGDLLETAFISGDKIFSALSTKISKYLEKEKEKLKEEGIHRVRRFVENVAPRYRAILSEVETELVNPDSTDKDLELQLHKKYAEVEAELIQEGQSISSEMEELSIEDGEKRLQEFLSKLERVKSSELSAYVFYRKYALDLLQKFIQLRADGKYEREETIHKLIFPMRETSDSIRMSSSNLWIIDERLAFHHYLASDKPLSSMSITTSTSRLEPDLLSLKIIEQQTSEQDLQIGDNPLLVSDSRDLHGSHASLTVVEFKRPMRNDLEAEDKDPIKQVLDYFQKIRDGKVTDVKGRPIEANQIPLYGYIIADLTPKMRSCCDYAELQETPDKKGYYGYKKKVGAYIEVISFERLIDAAYERNCAFFDKLGLGYTSLLEE